MHKKDYTYEEKVARNSRNRRLICWFQVQTFDEPELWRPRGTEVPAAQQAAELARSPLHTVAGLIARWGLQLFVGRYLCPTLGGHLLVEQWDIPRLFARVAHLRRATETHRPHAGDGAGGAGSLGSYLQSYSNFDAQPVSKASWKAVPLGAFAVTVSLVKVWPREHNSF